MITKIGWEIVMRNIATVVFGGVIGAAIFAAPVPALAAPSATPGFNCARAATEAEKLICQRPELAALDREIATAFAQALRRVDAKTGAALRKDQGIFVNVRNVLARPDYKFDTDPVSQRLRAMMADRRDFLRSVRKPSSRALLAGQWRRYSARLFLKALPPRNFEISGSGVDPLAARWTCELEGIAGHRNNLLVMDERATNGSQLSFVRDGDMLKVTEQLTKKTSVTPYCGHNGSVEGHYFYTGDRG